MMIYEHATLITVDPQRRIITDGALAVQDGRLMAIDKAAALRERFPAEPRTDLKGMVVTPGLINAHVHLAQAMIGGRAWRRPTSLAPGEKLALSAEDTNLGETAPSQQTVETS